ncbi:MAG: helix-turn-helix domain-containing protein [Oscillospiraceae bacterium]|nr:helix-turn-helix domain-containing protein [Oscillospiraceae bacterium]
MKLLLSVKEAAEALGISRSKLYELIHAEAFPTIWPGKVYELRKGGNDA